MSVKDGHLYRGKKIKGRRAGEKRKLLALDTISKLPFRAAIGDHIPPGVKDQVLMRAQKIIDKLNEDID